MFFTNFAAAQVDGFVELHSHLMGEHAFGGSWFSGVAEGPIEDAVPRCNGGLNWFGGEPHGHTRWPILSEFVGADTGLHLGRRRGFDTRECQFITILWWNILIPGTCPKPHFEQWPHSEAIAHQQMWEGWIQEARTGGMSVLVASLYESELLCTTTPPGTRVNNCNEMDSIERQADAIWDFVGVNSAWAGIALSAQQARDIIDDGRLAIVLSAELTNLFPTGNFITQLDEFHAMGIRSIQLAHHANSRFAGAATLPKTVGAANLAELLLANDFTDINDDATCNSFFSPTDCDPNPIGLTLEGEQLVEAMMDRGMILDVAHISRLAFDDVYDMAMDNGEYPLLNSHAHFADVIIDTNDGTTHHEKYMTLDQVNRIVETHGMVGLRTGPEHTIGVPVGDPCQGSARSFTQSVQYAMDQGLDVGFGADFNGFIKQARPCATVITDPELRDKGLAHIGLLPDFIQDMQNTGATEAVIEHVRDESAENFLVMWERAEAIGNNPTPAPSLPTAVCAMTVNILDTGDFGTNWQIGQVSMNASGSTADGVGNTIINYAWDLDLASGFSTPSTSATRSHTYHNAPLGNPISWTPRVRVTDAFGQTATTVCGTVSLN